MKEQKIFFLSFDVIKLFGGFKKKDAIGRSFSFRLNFLPPN